MPFIVFLVGMIFGLMFPRAKKGKEVKLIMALQLKDSQRVAVTVTGAMDAKGNAVALPEGTSYAFEVVPVEGSDPGVFTQDASNPAGGELVAGTAGTSGRIVATVTLPDGTTLLGQSDEFDVLAGAPVSVSVEFGIPEAE